MFTSNFRRATLVPTPVAISNGIASGYIGALYRPLAPPWDLIHGALAEEDYRAAYFDRVLSKLDPKKQYETLVSLYGENCTLLCFEDLSVPGAFCHRRMVADWFEQHLGILVPEWQPTRPTLSW